MCGSKEKKCWNKKNSCCNFFDARPTPDISWQKDGGELSSNRISFQNFQKRLKISDVNEADAGDYRCTATNRLGTAHHIIKVTVKGVQVTLTPTLRLRPKCQFIVRMAACATFEYAIFSNAKTYLHCHPQRLLSGSALPGTWYSLRTRLESLRVVSMGSPSLRLAGLWMESP